MRNIGSRLFYAFLFVASKWRDDETKRKVKETSKMIVIVKLSVSLQAENYNYNVLP